MRKRKLYLIAAIVFAFMFFSANSLLFAQSVVLTETEVKEDDSAVKMLFSTNRSIPVECYDLSVPPQIIVDFMGEIYTNKPEIMMVNKGIVKQMRIIRGTRKSTDLDDSFYAVDFIIVDLKESMRYDFAQGLTNSALVVSKPGKIVETKKAQQEVAKLTPKNEPAPIPVQQPVMQEQRMQMSSVAEPIPQASVKKAAPISFEEKEYEMPVMPKQEESQRNTSKRRSAQTKRGRVERQKNQKTMAEKSEAKETTSVGRMRKGIKNIFTFGGAKEEALEDKSIKEAGQPQVEIDDAREVQRKRRKPAVTKEAEAKSDSERMIRRRRQPKESAEAKEVKKAEEKADGKRIIRRRKGNQEEVDKAKQEAVEPQDRTVRRKRNTAAAQAAEPKRDIRKTRAKKATSEEDVYLNAIAAAKEEVEHSADELKQAEKDLSLAADNIGKANEAKQTIGQRIKDNAAKQEVLKSNYDESLKLATYAKNAANATWMEYSDAKAKLSLFLKNGAEAESIRKAEEIYEQTKADMSNAIKAAESAKADSDEALNAYNKAVQEDDKLLSESEYHKQNLGQEKRQYFTAEEIMHTKKQEHANAKRNLVEAEREYKQYEIDKSDAEYKASLFDIDETLALEAEKEERMKEAERAEQMRQMQAKEDAQTAALKQVQGKEDTSEMPSRITSKRRSQSERKPMEAEVAAAEKPETDGKGLIRRRRSNQDVEPKRRKAPPIEAPQPVQPRKEVLSTAVELRNSGLEMQRVGDFDSAVKYYKQALISDPEYATVHNDLGILYEQRGYNEKAKTEYIEALKINPQYIRAHSNLALLYEKTGDNSKAYYHWKQRVQLGRADDPWTQKAKQRMELLEQQGK